MKELKNYQREAIDKIRRRFDLYIEEEEGNSIVFKAPTGSGKTFIITKLLEEICSDIKYENQKLAFIWASIGKGELHKQSYRSVKSELKGNPSCELLDSTYVQSHKYIEDKQIIFVNWEKLVQKNSKDRGWKNSLMKDQEGRNFLDLIKETKEIGTKICLIVDESHIGEYKDTSISTFRDEILKPTLTIEMSATPKGKVNVDVRLDDAIEEGMIKESLIVNQGIGWDTDNESDSIQLVLEKAEKQRKLIVENYEKVGAKVNPLVLVQVPNTELGDQAIRVVEDFLESQDIDYKNGRLVKWLTGDKNFDSERMKRNNNEICYMIFKTVVDTGWDCPRAHILVKLRDVKSETSKIQTIGRILRTPEAKKYNNEILDNGYIFTNMEYIDPRNDEYSENRIKDCRAKVKEGLDKELPSLQSFYKSRVKSYNAADSRIYDIIEDVFCKYCGIKENEIFADDILREKGFLIDNLDKTSIISETKTKIEEINRGKRIGGGPLFNVDVQSSEIEIEGKVDDIISQSLNGLARVRSISPIISGLRLAIEYHISGLSRRNSYIYTLRLVSNNGTKFTEIISESTKRFKELFPDANMSGEYLPYEIPDEMAYSSSSYKELRCMLSLYDHMYVIKQGTSQLEENFTDELDNKYSGKIDWIWHNGSEPNVVNFGVEVEPDLPAFRPDYLVKFKDGRFGIFDTKSSGDFQIADTAKKAKALYRYINENKEAGKNIFGGIIVERNGNFFLNQNEEYTSYDEDPDSYTNIAFIF